MKWIHKGRVTCSKFECSNCGGVAYWPLLKRVVECEYPVCPWCGASESEAKQYIGRVRFTHPEALPHLIREIEIYCDSMEDAIKDMKERCEGCQILSIELTQIERGLNNGQRAE